VFTWQRSIDRLYVVRCLLAAIGASGTEDQSFIEELHHRAPSSPARPLTPEEIETILIHPDERGQLYRLLLASEPTLRKIIAPLEPSAASKPEKVSARNHPVLATMLSRSAKALGAPSFNACLVDGGIDQIRVEDTATPTLYVGRDALDRHDDREVAFLLGKRLAQIRLRHVLYARLEPEALGRVVAAILACTCHTFLSPYPAAALEELRLKLDKHLAKRVRRQLESIGLELADRPIDPARWRDAMEQSEDRVALTITGDLQAGLRCIRRTESVQIRPDQSTASIAEGAGPRLRLLLNFAVSEEHLTLRERMGMALTDA
jgi:hypothetical protein